jgi:hypothetical protein
MRPVPLLSALLLLTVFPPRAAEAQSKNSDRWQITTENGDYIWDIHLVRLTGDSLVYRQTDSIAAITVSMIKELRLIRKTEVRLGDGAGGAMAALTGADDEIYDFQTLDFPGRIRAIQQVLLAHPPEP